MTLLPLVLGAALLAGGAPCAAPAAGPLSLVLNLPAYRLELREGGETVREYTVAVGSRRYRTPLGRFAVRSVEVNPWWHPPDSEWARRERVTPPGPANPMGRAKLNFHELYFLHGTPQEASLGSAASHGCVRMGDADVSDLARRVLAAGRPGLPAEEVEAALADRSRTRRWTLTEPVPLEIVYRTAEVRGGALELHPDVYRRESTPLRSRALEALREAGVAPGEVDAAVLERALRDARRGHVRVELGELVPGWGG